MLRSIIVLLLFVVASTAWTQAEIDKSSLQVTEGIRAFHRGQYADAIKAFDSAEKNGSRDCRVFLIRGAAKLRLGQNAESDLEKGARLEVESGRRDIGRTLERFQGADRLKVEQMRREAKHQFRLAQTTKVQPAIAKRESETFRRRENYPPSEPPARLVVAEIPLVANQQDKSDPFDENAEDLFGRGELQVVQSEPDNETVAATENADEGGFENTEDVGFAENELTVDDSADTSPFDFDAADDTTDDTGSATGNATDAVDVAEDAMDEGLDFSDDGDATTEAPAPGGTRKKGGIFGAALRAFGGIGKPVLDQAKQGLNQVPIRVGPPPNAPNVKPVTPEATPVDASGDDPASSDEDPFDDEASDPPAKEPMEEKEEAGDPFLDE